MAFTAAPEALPQELEPLPGSLPVETLALARLRGVAGVLGSSLGGAATGAARLTRRGAIAATGAVGTASKAVSGTVSDTVRRIAPPRENQELPDREEQ